MCILYIYTHISTYPYLFNISPYYLQEFNNSWRPLQHNSTVPGVGEISLVLPQPPRHPRFVKFVLDEQEDSAGWTGLDRAGLC